MSNTDNSARKQICSYGNCENEAEVRCVHPESGPTYRCRKHRMTKTGEW